MSQKKQVCDGCSKYKQKTMTQWPCTARLNLNFTQCLSGNNLDSSKLINYLCLRDKAFFSTIAYLKKILVIISSCYLAAKAAHIEQAHYSTSLFVLAASFVPSKRASPGWQGSF